MQRKLTKISLGDLQHAYVPAQPVLSGRTVDIDLPGTRTYRQKSTLDILEEHQRLIRNLYKKQRTSASAPSRGRTFQSLRTSSEYSNRKVTLPSSENNFGKILIEIQGRPLTSGPSFSSCPKKDWQSTNIRRRPKTTGHLKNVHPLTDSYMVVREDKDLIYLSQSNQELSNKLHSYWTSENKSLTTGKFIRGQKRPDDVLPTLDSWLTFGGDSRAHSKGVIDAFASLRNSKEYYNIEGSVGSQVARQLQKGDKIRIGINGILQTQNFKVNTVNTDKISDVKSLFVKGEAKQDISKEARIESNLQGTKLTRETAIQWTETSKEEGEEETELARRTEYVTNFQSSNTPSDDDFKELVIPALDFQENIAEVEMQKPLTPNISEIPTDPVVENPFSEEETFETIMPSTPLSWSDQCSKPNVKIIHANISPKEILKPVMSETFPIKFEKLINEESRPQFAEVRPDGYKIKQRSAHTDNISRVNASKVKVVYIDPLTKEEEERVNRLSIDNIINHRLEGKNRESPAMLVTCGIKDHNDKSTNENTEQDNYVQPQRVSSTKSEFRSNPKISYTRSYSDHSSVHSPKLRVTPVHSSATCRVGNLRIMSTDTKNISLREDTAKTKKLLGKHTSGKSFRRTGVGQGNSIKTGLSHSEAEYIKITSQLKITPGSTPNINLSHQSAISSPFQNIPGGSTFQDLDYQVMDTIQLRNGTPENSTAEVEVSHSSDILNDNNVDENVKDESDSKEPESPASTTAPISIPTADEESFYLLPSRNMTNETLTVSEPAMEENEENNEEENIDQNVHKLEEHVTDSSLYIIS